MFQCYDNCIFYPQTIHNCQFWQPNSGQTQNGTPDLFNVERKHQLTKSDLEAEVELIRCQLNDGVKLQECILLDQFKEIKSEQSNPKAKCNESEVYICLILYNRVILLSLILFLY